MKLKFSTRLIHPIAQSLRECSSIKKGGKIINYPEFFLSQRNILNKQTLTLLKYTIYPSVYFDSCIICNF